MGGIDMTQEETEKKKEFLLRDLCARVPYGVKVQYMNNIFVIDYVSSYKEVKLNIPDSYTVGVSEVKPYLFPHSSMTEEQKEEYVALQQRVIYNSRGPADLDVMNYVDWCYKHHIDINGLIEKGLAIDATGLNIY